MSVNQMSVDQMSVIQMSVIQMFVIQMSVIQTFILKRIFHCIALKSKKQVLHNYRLEGLALSQRRGIGVMTRQLLTRQVVQG